MWKILARTKDTKAHAVGYLAAELERRGYEDSLIQARAAEELAHALATDKPVYIGIDTTSDGKPYAYVEPATPTSNEEMLRILEAPGAEKISAHDRREITRRQTRR